MGNSSFCKCFSQNLSFISSDPNKSSLNPEILELVKNKKYENSNSQIIIKPKPPAISLNDFKIEKVKAFLILFL